MNFVMFIPHRYAEPPVFVCNLLHQKLFQGADRLQILLQATQQVRELLCRLISVLIELLRKQAMLEAIPGTDRLADHGFRSGGLLRVPAVRLELAHRDGVPVLVVRFYDQITRLV